VEIGDKCMKATLKKSKDNSRSLSNKKSIKKSMQGKAKPTSGEPTKLNWFLRKQKPRLEE